VGGRAGPDGTNIASGRPGAAGGVGKRAPPRALPSCSTSPPTPRVLASAAAVAKARAGPPSAAGSARSGGGPTAGGGGCVRGGVAGNRVHATRWVLVVPGEAREVGPAMLDAW